MSLEQKQAWKLLESIQGALEESGKETWLAEDQESLKSGIEKYISLIKRDKASIDSLQAVIFFIQLTAFMKFETALKVIHIVNKAHPDFLGKYLDISLRNSELSDEQVLHQAIPIKGESLVSVRRFQLLLTFEVVGNLFERSRRRRVLRALDRINDRVSEAA